MARKTPATVATAAETAAPALRYCVVTRLSGAPARRAGRTWPEGSPTGANLTPAEIAALQADPRYRIEVGGEVEDSAADPVAALPPLSPSLES